MSQLEYEIARRAGFDPAKILVNGLARPRSFLELCAAEGACIFVETERDVETVCEIGHSHPIRIGLRIHPHLSAEDGSPYAVENKLGLNANSEYFASVVDKLGRSPGVTIEALHCHFAINDKSGLSFERVAVQLAALLARLDTKLGRIGAIDLGGGYGTFEPGEEAAAHALFQRIGKYCARHLPGRSIWVEPGRYLTNACGYLIATVLDRKPLADGTVLIVSDAGTNVLIPVPSARYRLVDPAPASAGVELMIADGITSPENVVIKRVVVERAPAPNDRIVLGNVGAYTSVFSHFWAYEPCTVGFIDRVGVHRFWIGPQELAACRAALFGDMAVR